MHSRKMQENERLFKKGKMWYGKTQSQEFDRFLLAVHSVDFRYRKNLISVCKCSSTKYEINVSHTLLYQINGISNKNILFARPLIQH